MPDDQPDTQSDPAIAFEDLRTEVSVLRKAVEALPAAMRDNRPPDYAQDLAVIGKGLDDIGGQLETIQKFPALRMTPEQQGQSIANAGSTMLREAAQKLERAAQDADRERRNLAQMMGTLDTNEQRRRFWAMTLQCVFVLGFLAFPFAMRVMPGNFRREVAATILDANQWDAGVALMRAGNPDGWAQLAADASFTYMNHDQIKECQRRAKIARKEGHCIVIVKAR